MLGPRFLWGLIRSQAPQFAHACFDGDQFWSDRNAPFARAYDPTKPWDAPEQDPRITTVNGDLHLTGNFPGGDLLIVMGRILCSGPYRHGCLVLGIGSCSVTTDGSGPGINGGAVTAGLIKQNGGIVFGDLIVSIGGGRPVAELIGMR